MIRETYAYTYKIPTSDGDCIEVAVPARLWGRQGAEDQLTVMIEALLVYSERNLSYKDNWKKMGWRGMLVRSRERVERLWDDFWGREPIPDGVDELFNVDDAIDLINFACFFIRATRENNRDGSWWEGV